VRRGETKKSLLARAARKLAKLDAPTPITPATWDRGNDQLQAELARVAS